ncbi:hypothetical protein UFOVP1254_41 [uncultured Caudovirales phage]|uniref:Uncharacterized protein n=1 Tax=uncultured Caudovirales phage TaxID=2100421 RepID=A0A6J5RA02_9CAUD|nr:hypothetical protein UFOVP1254_41 [uncultured Caudovirales phage]
MTTLAQLRAIGFDEAKVVPFTKTYKIRCSQCTATVVNGTPIHERSCPNEKVECKGCNNLIPALTARCNPYCEDCR